MRSEPQVSNHESADAKDAFIDVTSPAGAAWKQRPGRGVQVGTQVETPEPQSSARARRLPNLLSSSVSGIHTGVFATVLWSYPQQDRNLQRVS